MNFRKTIELLKHPRPKAAGGTSLPDALAAAPPNVCEPPFRPGWYSPDYCHSRRVVLDQQRMRDNRIISEATGSMDNDTYKVLKTQIQQRTAARGWNTIMVTSPSGGEGKTLTAINLAMAFAKDFDRTVLLVDCDLKRQMIHRYLGIDGDIGLIDYLLDEHPMNDLIVWPGIEKLTLMSGGRPIEDSTELLGSPQMRLLVEEMKSRYENRYIIFDVPPILDRSESIAFTPLVDGVVIVVEHGKTTLPDIRQALSLIPREKIIGFVLNAADNGRPYAV
ncbi:MAG: AAA family ATPase [Pseudomonadota bacterium]